MRRIIHIKYQDIHATLHYGWSPDFLMAKKKKFKENIEEELELLESEMKEGTFFEHHKIDPLKTFAVLLFIFACFSFFALFGMAGSFGDFYFTFITDAIGLFAYITPFLYLFICYLFFFRAWKVFKYLNFYLFTFLLLDSYMMFGFFHITGKIGNTATANLQESFGSIPTLLVLFITGALALLRIFEADIMDLFGIQFAPSKPEPKKVVSVAEPVQQIEKEILAQTEDVVKEEKDAAPGLFSRIFGFGKKKDNVVEVNHMEELGLGQEDEYEEIEEEVEVDRPEDYRTAMFKAVSVDLGEPEKEKVKVKKLIKKEKPALPEPVQNFKKDNQEMLRQINEKYNRPPLSLYTEDSGKASAGDNKENARIIKRTLSDFGISVEMDEVTVGPTVTRYALKPAQGVKIEKIINLGNNIALELGVPSVSITRVPERSLIGIEVPNKQKASLGIGSLLSKKDFLERKEKLTMSLGKDIYGEPVFVDMAKMPHLLIAGTTGSGKSSLIHALINSLIYKNSPYDLKFILVDPKKVEFALYGKLPHLLTPVIKEPKKAVQTLNWLVQEMDRRYAILEDSGKQNINAYYAFVMEKYKKAESRGPDTKEKLPEKMPYIVLVIDELADFMMKYPKEMESGIVKLAQMSRAVGIHLILATQRPSTNVITGVIKGNIPSRVALRVASQVDSRVIIDQGGAEKLLGYGDLLFVNADGSDLKRIQSPFVREEEIKDAVAYLREEYDELIAEELKSADGGVVGAQNMHSGGNVSDADFSSEDDKYEQAKEIVMQTGKTSISNLQVRLGTGYARSAKLINMLEQAGVIITVTDNSGKKVKVVAGQGNTEVSKDENASNTREDILKVEESENAEEEGQDSAKEKSGGGFFRF